MYITSALLGSSAEAHMTNLGGIPWQTPLQQRRMWLRLLGLNGMPLIEYKYKNLYKDEDKYKDKTNAIAV